MTAFPVTERIARFVVETTLEKIPAAALATAKTAVQDTLGVGLAGSQDEAGTIAARLATGEGAREEASLLGRQARTSAQQAAFANGVATHALDYDYGLATGGQPVAPVLAATLAMAEATGVTGARLLEAYVVGFEVTAKISDSLYNVVQHGWHAPGNMGTLGATAACAKVLGMSEEQTRHALGMAVSMAGGVEANFGTMTKPLHVGHAARNAVVAAKLAADGFTANVGAIEVGTGYYDAYYRIEPGADSPLDSLGRTWELVESGLKIKPYPCGGLAHTSIDAGLALRDEVIAAGGTDAVESVVVEVTDRVAGRIVFGVPETELQAKFSMPYLIARALVDGRVGLDAFTDEAIEDESVLSVAAKVSMVVGPDLKSSKVGRPSVVTVRMRDGGTLVKRVDAPKGSEAMPMTPAELRAKFHECAARTMDVGSADAVLEAIDGLDKAVDLGTLAGLLRG
jgi:2-methylcitrate dehydratase PrpD